MAVTKRTSIEAKIRDNKCCGKSHSRRLRANGLLPAVVYQLGQEQSLHIILDQNQLWHAVNNGDLLENVELTLDDGRKMVVRLWDYTKHPVKKMLLHLDFKIMKQ